MRVIKHFLVILIGLTFIMTGCSQDTEESTKNTNKAKPVETKAADQDEVQKDQEEEPVEEEIVVDALPATYEELEDLPQGPYHEFYFLQNDEDKKMVIETFKDLPDVSKDPTEIELDLFYMELLKLVQKDYKGPEEAIKRLKFQAIGSPEMKDTRYEFKENLNVEIILDASGSMAQEVDGKVKMAAAKDAIKKFVQQLPKDAKVGLRVYGHKGSNAESDKQVSCSSSEIMYPISNYDSGNFQSSLDKIKPTGWTPIGLALNEVKKDLSKFDGAANTNIVYLVSDGISTCDDDPIEAAKSLFDSNISPIVNVIGFDIDNEGQKQLKEIAAATDGIYSSVADESELSEELSQLNQLAQTWEEWKKSGMQNIELKKVENKIDIFSYITDELSKNIDEKVRIDLISSVFWQEGRMTAESRVYLEEKNREYHDWMRAEIERFKEELHSLNELNYAEAVKLLEEKYEKNTQ